LRYASNVVDEIFSSQTKGYKPDNYNYKTCNKYLETYKDLFDKVRSIFDEL